MDGASGSIVDGGALDGEGELREGGAVAVPADEQRQGLSGVDRVSVTDLGRDSELLDEAEKGVEGGVQNDRVAGSGCACSWCGRRRGRGLAALQRVRKTLAPVLELRCGVLAVGVHPVQVVRQCVDVGG